MLHCMNNEYPATVGQPILAAAGFQPASRAGAYVYFGAKKAERRLRAELPAPHGRRDFLRQIGAGALSLTFANSSFAAEGKPLRGLFPIGQTPCTPDNKLDLDSLAAEVRFCNRGGVHGFVWPQIASGWAGLTQKERMDGAEAILAAGKGGKTALVIGVQTLGGGAADAVEYAKHAASHGADAIVSLPPEGADADAMLAYYKTIGKATDLPLFVQTTGNMSVDLVVRMFKEIPTMRVVKDEAGNPLQRVAEIRERTGGKLNVFSGNGVRTMITEMRRGFSGHCPTTGLADIYAQAFDLWHSGRQREGFDMFGRVLAFDSIPNAGSYVLIARGVFKEDTITRASSTPGGAGRPAPLLDEAGKQEIREALSSYLKPYLRG
jgi:4-hydroxy-tetrahydrodipicolinate synthase